MKYLFFIFNLIIFYNYSSFADENVNLYSKTGDKLTITLPSGYCDITNTQAGKFLKDHFKRNWKYINDQKTDQHVFCLVDPVLGSSSFCGWKPLWQRCMREHNLVKVG